MMARWIMFLSIDDIDDQCPRGLNKTTTPPEVWRSHPFNDTCLRSMFLLMDQHMRRYSEGEEFLYTTIYVVLSFLAVIGNGVVILAVIRKKEMRTNRNVLIVNLALSNLMLAITNVPFLWLPSMDFEFPYSRFFCKFANALPGSNIYCSTFTICVMAIDRYYSVRQMQTAPVKRKCMFAVCLSVGIWVMSFLLSFPLLVYYDTSMLYVFKDVTVFDNANGTRLSSYGWRQCGLTSGRSANDEIGAQIHMIQLVVSLLQVAFLYLVPTIVLAIFNVKLTRFLKVNARQMNRNRRDNRALANSLRVSARGSDGSISANISKSNGYGSPSDAGSAARRASDKRRSRTTQLLFAMAGSYAILWLPFTVVSFLIDFNILYYVQKESANIIERIDQICKIVSIASICVNPFLYGFLNTNFRNEFTDIFNTWIRCLPRGKLFNNDYSSAVFAAKRCSMAQDGETFIDTFRRSVRKGSAPRTPRTLAVDANSAIRPISTDSSNLQLQQEHTVVLRTLMGIEGEQMKPLNGELIFSSDHESSL
ncbi:hypothetical protein QR680_002177 [Steinernema hermaphroditum]|uniref:G-protein coupled receptors family 1 profile domain-containing protein n=1 Tax=Steinernema hermaphroditum TaxID=289476 RepID=A0AA39H1N0_9BILA|nr:hypothetical protein QR680_002177 [Steinernema hermaphroditum]